MSASPMMIHSQGVPPSVDAGVAGEPGAAPESSHLLRFGFTPLYTRFADAWDAAAQLHDVLRSGAYRDDRFARRGKVT